MPGRRRATPLPAPEVDRIIVEMDKRMHMRAHQIPTRLLWHYTTPEGLMGMVQGQGTIWATHYQHMNDRNEVHVGHDIVVDELAHMQKGSGLEGRMAAFLHKVIKPNPASSLGEIFVASLTLEGDLLSQWRGYARNGSGYALGFRFTKQHLPHGLDPNSNLGLALRRCVYDKEQFRGRVRRVVRRGIEDLKGYARRVPRSDWPRIERNGKLILLASLSTLSVTLKDGGFSEEQEYRLAAFWDPREGKGTHQIGYRPGASGVVPYMALPIGHATTHKLPLAAVRLGPGHDVERGKPTIERFLQQHGYPDVEVLESAIPFRG